MLFTFSAISQAIVGIWAWGRGEGWVLEPDCVHPNSGSLQVPALGPQTGRSEGKNRKILLQKQHLSRASLGSEVWWAPGVTCSLPASILKHGQWM